MGDKSSSQARTPARKANTTHSSTGKQQSILGFFSRANSSPNVPSPSVKQDKTSSCLKETTKSNSLSFAKRPSTSTPVCSDAVEPLSSQENKDSMQIDTKVSSHTLPSPDSSSEIVEQPSIDTNVPVGSSPPRKVTNPPPLPPKK